MRLRGAAAAVAIVAMLAGCGQKDARTANDVTAPAAEDTPAASGPTAEPIESNAAAAQPKQKPAPTAPTAAEGRAPDATPAGASTSPGAGADPTGANNRLPLTGVVTPACAKRGQVVRVDLTTRPHAEIVGMVVYSDKDPRGTHTLGYADGTGKYIWDVTVPASAPYGRVEVEMLGRDRTPGATAFEESSNGDNAHTTLIFRVAKSC